MNNRRTLCTALFSLMTILACVIPGVGEATPADPAPTVDTGRLQAMVAETVAAAIAQTEQAAPVDQPDTPGPTETMTPESGLYAQTDGTIQFVDFLARFQLNVSPGWLPVRINQQEYYDAFSLPVANEPLQRELTDIKTLDPNIFRLFVYDLQDGHMLNGVITGIDFVWDSEGGISLDNDADIQEAADDLAASTPGLNISSSSVSATLSGIPIGVILSDVPGKTFDGTDVVLFQKHVHLNLPAGVLVISFTTEQNFKDATLPFFDTMIETIKIDQ